MRWRRTFRRTSILKTLRLFLWNGAVGAGKCRNTRLGQESTECHVADLALTSHVGWQRSGRDWVAHFNRNRGQARHRNEEAGHRMWGPMALKRQLSFAGHIARSPEDSRQTDRQRTWFRNLEHTSGHRRPLWRKRNGTQTPRKRCHALRVGPEPTARCRQKR